MAFNIFVSHAIPFCTAAVLILFLSTAGATTTIKVLRNCNGAVVMNRTAYLEPGYSDRDGWEATVNLAKWKKFDSILMILPQTGVTVAIWDRSTAEFESLEDGWFIQVFKPLGGFNKFTFQLEASPDQIYPEITSLIINGEEVCKTADKFGNPHPEVEDEKESGSKIKEFWDRSKPKVKEAWHRETSNLGESVSKEASRLASRVKSSDKLKKLWEKLRGR